MKLKISLLILTTISIIAMVWAGFTRNDALLPLLLNTTVALSMAHLMLDAKKGKVRSAYMLAMSLAIFSIVIYGVTLFI
ncbi:hypothetical protein [Guptibacillus algicola]|uniref:hypothetical protein n=1 Tax=Guptibacillus algicola TaxID=225844 RepID=UPI001CD669DC|nr:hypothetical protein [Alkalihalobacillus algicola]MCA0987393.1 hypothetical protein [Alkalihalobacillus algicola]